MLRCTGYILGVVQRIGILQITCSQVPINPEALVEPIVLAKYHTLEKGGNTTKTAVIGIG
jgi:hypothetical protein